MAHGDASNRFDLRGHPMTRRVVEPPRKVRWTVPGADVSVIDWLDAQENVSQSLRLLIREAIQRDGFIDVAFKPVEQLPRRGRPLADAVVEQSGRSEEPTTPSHVVGFDAKQPPSDRVAHMHSGDGAPAPVNGTTASTAKRTGGIPDGLSSFLT